MKEYRAIFRYPEVFGYGPLDPVTGLRGIGQPPDGYSQPVTDPKRLGEIHPPRPEETHAWVAGIQVREVGPWENQS